MSPWTKLAELKDVPEGQLWPVECAGRSWVVVREGLSVRCFFDRCSHQDVRLSDFAQLDVGGGILCFAHGARFCSRSGTPLSFPGTTSLWVAEVKVEGAEIWIRPPHDLPDAD